jgi:hypothetical protein
MIKGIPNLNKYNIGYSVLLWYGLIIIELFLALVK